MHYEFEQLMEALWAGRLDQTGRRRLGELCAADPTLASRLRQERNLSNLLSRCGPNHAPADLARNVLTRIEARNYVRLRTPWYAVWFGWLFLPAVRTAVAFTVIAAIGVEAGMLMHNYKTQSSQSVAAPLAASPAASSYKSVATNKKQGSSRSVASVDREKTGKKNENSATRPAPARNRTGSEAKSAASGERRVAQAQPQFSPQGEVITEEFPAPITGGETGRGFGGGGFGGGVKNLAMRTNDDNIPGAPLAPSMTLPAAPAPGPAVTPSVPLYSDGAPAVPASGAAAAKPLSAALADREVAMAITLNTAVRPPAAFDRQPEKPVQPLNIPGIKTFAPQEGQPQAEALSLKTIEVSLYAVGAEKVQSTPVAGRKGAWEVRTSLTPEQFRRFGYEMRKSGILPGETIKGEASSANADQMLSASTISHYDITHGEQWLKPLERLAVDPSLQRQAGGTSATRSLAPAAPSNRLELRIMVEEFAPAKRR